MDEMNITSAQYVEVTSPDGSTEKSGVKSVIDGVSVLVPLDQANRHYAEILRQVEAGTLTIADAD